MQDIHRSTYLSLLMSMNLDQMMNQTASMDLDQVINQAASVWVFGYGSLLWKPDFSYRRKEVGHIQGFKRRFWQGNQTHRGTKDRIARVATLIPAKQGKVWGVAFEISGKEAISKALGGLTTREITLGGYDVVSTQFHPRDKWTEPRPVMLYMATRDNDMFLGKSDIDTMAMEVVLASGHAGHNVEYVTKLAEYVKKHIPEDHDRHLFALDKRVRQLARVLYNNCLYKWLGNAELFERHSDVVDEYSNSGNDVTHYNPKFLEKNHLHSHSSEHKHRMIY